MFSLIRKGCPEGQVRREGAGVTFTLADLPRQGAPIKVPQSIHLIVLVPNATKLSGSVKTGRKDIV